MCCSGPKAGSSSHTHICSFAVLDIFATYWSFTPRRPLPQGERFILEATTESIFLSDQRQVSSQTENTQHLNVDPNCYGRYTTFDLVECWARNANPGTDRLHREATAKSSILETLA